MSELLWFPNNPDSVSVSYSQSESAAAAAEVSAPVAPRRRSLAPPAFYAGQPSITRTPPPALVAARAAAATAAANQYASAQSTPASMSDAGASRRSTPSPSILQMSRSSSPGSALSSQKRSPSLAQQVLKEAHLRMSLTPEQRGVGSANKENASPNFQNQYGDYAALSPLRFPTSASPFNEVQKTKTLLTPAIGISSSPLVMSMAEPLATGPTAVPINWSTPVRAGRKSLGPAPTSADPRVEAIKERVATLLKSKKKTPTALFTPIAAPITSVQTPAPAEVEAVLPSLAAMQLTPTQTTPSVVELAEPADMFDAGMTSPHAFLSAPIPEVTVEEVLNLTATTDVEMETVLEEEPAATEDLTADLVPIDTRSLMTSPIAASPSPAQAPFALAASPSPAQAPLAFVASPVPASPAFRSAPIVTASPATVSKAARAVFSRDLIASITCPSPVAEEAVVVPSPQPRAEVRVAHSPVQVKAASTSLVAATPSTTFDKDLIASITSSPSAIVAPVAAPTEVATNTVQTTEVTKKSSALSWILRSLALLALLLGGAFLATMTPPHTASTFATTAPIAVPRVYRDTTATAAMPAPIKVATPVPVSAPIRATPAPAPVEMAASTPAPIAEVVVAPTPVASVPTPVEVAAPAEAAAPLDPSEVVTTWTWSPEDVLAEEDLFAMPFAPPSTFAPSPIHVIVHAPVANTQTQNVPIKQTATPSMPAPVPVAAPIVHAEPQREAPVEIAKSVEQQPAPELETLSVLKSVSALVSEPIAVAEPIVQMSPIETVVVIEPTPIAVEADITPVAIIESPVVEELAPIQAEPIPEVVPQIIVEAVEAIVVPAVESTIESAPVSVESQQVVEEASSTWGPTMIVSSIVVACIVGGYLASLESSSAASTDAAAVTGTSSRSSSTRRSSPQQSSSPFSFTDAGAAAQQEDVFGLDATPLPSFSRASLSPIRPVRKIHFTPGSDERVTGRATLGGVHDGLNSAASTPAFSHMEARLRRAEPAVQAVATAIAAGRLHVDVPMIIPPRQARRVAVDTPIAEETEARRSTRLSRRA